MTFKTFKSCKTFVMLKSCQSTSDFVMLKSCQKTSFFRQCQSRTKTRTWTTTKKVVLKTAPLRYSWSKRTWKNCSKYFQVQSYIFFYSSVKMTHLFVTVLLLYFYFGFFGHFSFSKQIFLCYGVSGYDFSQVTREGFVFRQ